MSKDQAQVAGGAHMAHDHNPPQAFVKQIAERGVVGNGFDSVGKKLYLQALFRDETTDQKVVRGTIFKSFISAEKSEVRTGGGDSGAKRKFHAVKLARDENAGEKIGNHPDHVQILGKRSVARGNVEAGNGAHGGVPQRGYHGAEVIGLDADIAVVDHQNFMLGFAGEAGKFGYFVVDTVSAGTIDDANVALRKILDELLNDGNGGVTGLADAEEQFELGIILTAEARKVQVRIGVKAPDGLDVTDRRRKAGRPL